ncbi:MAG TPA: DUF1624 domain-containing protein [Pseudaminobacter sp.]|jgi:uncharacterized membrane protein|nr:DUF1624 domain-containing protein [Pseudaminobacter sp.]
MYPEQSRPKKASTGRIEALDVARGLALAAMAIYHFAWDMEFFGYADAGMTATGGWKLFARCIASSFLFLVGVSLFLAHGRGIRWKGFWRRLAMVAGAAAAISLVTWLAVPGGFIFFGILHQIALASLLGLAFLRLPWWLTLIAAAAVIAAPNFLRSEFFAHPAWWWTGLSPVNPRSNDYVPVFPWFGAVLIGLASANLAASLGFFTRLADVDTGRWSRPLAFAGRHSLAVYLVHQPVLIAGLWLFAQAFPAPVETPEVQFRASCEATCEESRDAEFCTRYCVCMLDALEPDGLLKKLFAGDQSAELRSQIETFAGQCTVETDNAILEGGAP